MYSRSIPFMIMALSGLLGVVYLQTSPPDIPETFQTNFTEINTQNKSLTAVGRAFEDDEKELVYLERKEELLTEIILFNKMLYRIVEVHATEDRPFCECQNITYKEIGYPLFNFVKDFKQLYFQNETVEIWEPEGQGNIPVKGKDLLYFTVKKSDRNVPLQICQKYLFERLIVQNTTFSDFNPTAPDSSIFDVPDLCMNVKCRNSQPQQRKWHPSQMGKP